MVIVKLLEIEGEHAYEPQPKKDHVSQRPILRIARWAVLNLHVCEGDGKIGDFVWKISDYRHTKSFLVRRTIRRQIHRVTDMLVATTLDIAV